MRGAWVMAVAAASVVLAACTPADEGPVEPVDLEIRPVLLGELAGAGWEGTDPAALEGLGIGPAGDVKAAVDWLVAGDCDAPAPELAELRVACDAESSYSYLLAADPLTQDDVASASVHSNFADANEPYFEFLDVKLTAEGAERYKSMTHYASITPSSEGRIAVLLDGVVISVLVAREAVTDGELTLASPGKTRDWEPIARALNAGAS